MRPYNDHIPFIQYDTPLHKIPREWIILVEPKLIRGRQPIPTCWLWADALGPRDCDVNGEPRMRVAGKQVLLKDLIARLFWPRIEIGTKHYVYHHCGTRNCLNPNHFLVAFDHPSQINLDGIVKEKRISLSRWRARERWKATFGAPDT